MYILVNILVLLITCTFARGGVPKTFSTKGWVKNILWEVHIPPEIRFYYKHTQGDIFSFKPFFTACVINIFRF